MAKASSFFSSSAWKRRFSSSTTRDPPAASDFAIASRAAPPMQSLANTTSRPSNRDRCSATGLRLNSGATLPLGRPRCEARMTVDSWSSANWMLGSAAVMRVSSVMTPFLSGTLKSTRMKTRRSSSGRSRIEYLVMSRGRA